MRVYITGDIHGEYEIIKEFCKDEHTTRNDVLIILGDFGVNYFLDFRDEVLKNKICSLPITIFAVRGNHEERPSKIKNIEKECFFGNAVYVEKCFPNIKYAIDGLDYEITIILTNLGWMKQTVRFGVIGGAHSIDKNLRLFQNLQWFEGEQLSEKEQEEIYDYFKWIKNKNHKIDFFLSHAAPKSLVPKEFFITSYNSDLPIVEDHTTENFLDKIYNLFPDVGWLFGHYHGDKVINTDGLYSKIILYKKIMNLEDYLTKCNIDIKGGKI